MAGGFQSRAMSVVEDVVAARDLRAAYSSFAAGVGQLFGASRAIVAPCSESPAIRSPIEWGLTDLSPEQDAALLHLLERLGPYAADLEYPLSIERPEEAAELAAEADLIRKLGFTGLTLASAQDDAQPYALILVATTDAERETFSEDQLSVLDYLSRVLGATIRNLGNGHLQHDEPAEAHPRAALFVDEQGRIAGADPEIEKYARLAVQPLIGRSLAELVDQSRETQASEEQRYRRLVEHSDALIFNTDADHRLTFISRRALDFFGIEPAELVERGDVRWYDLVHPDDQERISVSVAEALERPKSFDEEFRVLNHVSGKVRWLLTKLIPVWDRDERLLGWDGFGINITPRKEAQAGLDAQSRKVRALYTVSSAIRGFLDPANIAARGLAALCDATGAEAGLCYLYPLRHTGALSLVAHHGFSAGFADRVDASSTLQTLCTYVAEHGQSIVVPDIRTDPRANKMLSDEEGMRSALLVPISVEDEILGTLGLFHHDGSRFDGGDVMLVSAAANQIGLAARQANLFTAYRRQTKNLSALYRLSHELSGFLSLDEIFQKAFTVIRDELGLKRLWLGLLNETGTRVIGQAAYGPGWKRRMVEINVEIKGRDHPIAQVVTTRKPMIIDDPDKVLSEFGVKRFFSRFAINSVGLVPLISGGQVLGALAFQPGSEDPSLDDEEITLLSSLAAEIAASLLAKRLEERVGESEKMQSTGLLAAGIAHNFNNLLQAIMGQASLLEMQTGHGPEVLRASQIISEAATKGASLVRQLMSFANLEEPLREVCDVNAVIERGISSLTRQLAGGQKLTLTMGEHLPRGFVDSRQLMRILNVLVTNAQEAMDANGVVHIFTESITVDRESPHYEVPYGEYLRIGVRDNGQGMDAEAKRRCFEPFYTTKNVDPNSGLSLSGAGLGLAAAYALARKNGGRLVVDSRKGHGSLFTLYVPVAQERSRPAGRPAEAAADEAGSESDEQLRLEIEHTPNPVDAPLLGARPAPRRKQLNGRDRPGKPPAELGDKKE